MKLFKCVVLFFFVLGFYIGNSVLVNDPPGWVPSIISLVSFWVNNCIELPKKILVFCTDENYYQSHGSVLKFIIPGFWTLIASFFIKDKENQFDMLEKLDSGFAMNEKEPVFQIKGFKKKLYNSLGWFFLTDLEDFVLYKFTMLMPANHRKTVIKQLKLLNRTHRIRTNEGGNICITAFDKISFAGHKKKITSVLDNDEPYECVIASGLLVSRKHYIAVDLIATQGVISRLQFQSDNNIDDIKGNFTLQDVVIHHSLTDKKKIYGEDYDEEVY